MSTYPAIGPDSSGDRYILERKRRLVHRIPIESSAPPYIARCGRVFVVIYTAIQEDAPPDIPTCAPCEQALAFRQSLVRQ